MGNLWQSYIFQWTIHSKAWNVHFDVLYSEVWDQWEIFIYLLFFMFLIFFFNNDFNNIFSLSLHLFDQKFRKISSMVLFYYILKCLFIHVISKMNFQQSLLQSSPLKNKIDDPNLCLMYVFCLSYHRSSEEFGTVYSSLLCQQQISIAGSSSAWNDPAGLSFFC